MNLLFRPELCEPKPSDAVRRTNESFRRNLIGGTYSPRRLDDVPDVFHSIAEFTACYASAQAVVADTDSVILVHVCKIVLAFCHGANEDADALVGTNVVDIVSNPDDVRLITEGDLSAIRRKMIRDGILNDFE